MHIPHVHKKSCSSLFYFKDCMQTVKAFSVEWISRLEKSIEYSKIRPTGGFISL